MSRLRIGIVALNVRRASSGSNEAYLRGLLAGLVRVQPPDVELHIYASDGGLIHEAISEHQTPISLHEMRLPRGKLSLHAARLLCESRIALFGANDVLLFTGTSIALAAKCPQVAVVHWDTKLQPKSAPLLQAYFNTLMLRQMSRRAAFAIVPTVAYGRHLESCWGFSAAKVVPIHHGVSIPASINGVTKTAKRVVAVTNDLPHKNLPVLLAAWADVTKRLPEARLTLAGRVGDEALDASGVAWRPMAAEGALIRTDWIDHDAVMREIAASSLLVSPSEGETFCLPLAEAMAVGTPVIAADTLVAREVCGEAAIYCRVRDSSALADAIIRLLCDPQQARDLAAAGLDRARQFTWDTVARRTVETLQAAAVEAASKSSGAEKHLAQG